MLRREVDEADSLGRLGAKRERRARAREKLMSTALHNKSGTRPSFPMRVDGPASSRTRRRGGSRCARCRGSTRSGGRSGCPRASRRSAVRRRSVSSKHNMLLPVVVHKTLLRLVPRARRRRELLLLLGVVGRPELAAVGNNNLLRRLAELAADLVDREQRPRDSRFRNTPNTTWRSSHSGLAAKVKKNCEPLESNPRLHIERHRPCASMKFSSGKSPRLKMLRLHVPLPFAMSPPWQCESRTTLHILLPL